MQDDELDEETKILLESAQDEDAILKSPTVSIASNSPDEPPPPIIDDTKKISLKRKLLIDTQASSIDSPVAVKNTRIEAPSATSANSVAGTVTTASEDNSTNDDDQQVKFAGLTLEKRLEMRAKKFGIPVSSNAVKQTRAERFGIKPAKEAPTNGAAAASNKSAETITNNAPATNVNLLMKRAERFGGSVSKVMNSVEQNEKLLKRQERFGLSAAPTTAATVVPAAPVASLPVASAPSTDSSAPKTDYAEKARLRLERFKTAANWRVSA